MKASDPLILAARQGKLELDNLPLIMRAAASDAFNIFAAAGIEAPGLIVLHDDPRYEWMALVPPKQRIPPDKVSPATMEKAKPIFLAAWTLDLIATWWRFAELQRLDPGSLPSSVVRAIETAVHLSAGRLQHLTETRLAQNCNGRMGGKKRTENWWEQNGEVRERAVAMVRERVGKGAGLPSTCYDIAADLNRQNGGRGEDVLVKAFAERIRGWAREAGVSVTD